MSLSSKTLFFTIQLEEMTACMLGSLLCAPLRFWKTLALEKSVTEEWLTDHPLSNNVFKPLQKLRNIAVACTLILICVSHWKLSVKHICWIKAPFFSCFLDRVNIWDGSERQVQGVGGLSISSNTVIDLLTAKKKSRMSYGEKNKQFSCHHYNSYKELVTFPGEVKYDLLPKISDKQESGLTLIHGLMTVV